MMVIPDSCAARNAFRLRREIWNCGSSSVPSISIATRRMGGFTGLIVPESTELADGGRLALDSAQAGFSFICKALPVTFPQTRIPKNEQDSPSKKFFCCFPLSSFSACFRAERFPFVGARNCRAPQRAGAGVGAQGSAGVAPFSFGNAQGRRSA